MERLFIFYLLTSYAKKKKYFIFPKIHNPHADLFSISRKLYHIQFQFAFNSHLTLTVIFSHGIVIHLFIYFEKIEQKSILMIYICIFYRKSIVLFLPRQEKLSFKRQNKKKNHLKNDNKLVCQKQDFHYIQIHTLILSK